MWLNFFLHEKSPLEGIKIERNQKIAYADRCLAFKELELKTEAVQANYAISMSWNSIAYILDMAKSFCKKSCCHRK